MTIYAGEVIQVRHGGTDVNGDRIGPLDGIEASITIWDLDRTVLVTSPMEYDPDLIFDDGATGGWFYYWTSPSVAGVYEAKCEVIGFGVAAWEFKTIRTRPNRR